MHLQTLAVEGDLEVVRSRGMSGLNIYLITSGGLRKVTDYRTGQLHRRRPSGSHLPHELLITELAVLLKQSARENIHLNIEWQERFAFYEHACFQGLVPDYAFLTSQPQGRVISLVEVSSGEESITRLRQKLTAYSAWSGTDEASRFLIDLYARFGAARPQPQFRLLCVMHHRRGGNDEVAVQQLIRASAEVTPGMRRRIWCTTANVLAGQNTLSAPVWIRLADLEAIFTEAATYPLRDFNRRLAMAQRSAPRHALFSDESAP